MDLLNKKIPAIILVAILAVSLTACGSGNSSSPAGSQAETETLAETQPGSEAAETEAEETEGPAETAVEFSLDDYDVFSSDSMDFTFLYNEAHAAYQNEEGAAVLAINGDDSIPGLTVKCYSKDGASARDGLIADLIEEKKEKYGAAMVLEPKEDVIEVEGHDLKGIQYEYQSGEGDVIFCTDYIDELDDCYVFYRTAAKKDKSGPELYAMGIAIGSLVPNSGHYGANEAIIGNFPKEETIAEIETETESSENKSSEVKMNSGFHFDVKDSYKVVSDEITTKVYTKGKMDGPNFYVNAVDMGGMSVDSYLSQRSEELSEQYGDRMVGSPQLNDIELGSRVLHGIVYEYKSEDGSKTVRNLEYLEALGNNIFEWRAVCDKGDDETEDAMFTAMGSFVVE